MRTYLHLAMALILLSLTCDIGAVCAMADSGSDCCCQMEGMEAPCTDMSGSDDEPGAPEPAATIDSGERFSLAILDATPGVSAPGVLDPASRGRIGPAFTARSTPLYLSHCAFLC